MNYKTHCFFYEIAKEQREEEFCEEFIAAVFKIRALRIEQRIPNVPLLVPPDMYDILRRYLIRSFGLEPASAISIDGIRIININDLPTFSELGVTVH